MVPANEMQAMIAIKNNVIKEMLHTEETYNQGMDLLKLALENDDLVKDDPILLKFKPLITQLNIISHELLNNVSIALTENISDKERKYLKSARTQLVKAFIVAYATYPKLYIDYTKAVADKPARFQPIADFIRDNNNRNLDLASYLILPFQRGPRYEMLADAALKNSEHLNPTQIAEITELSEMFKNGVAAANKAMPKEDKPEPYRFGNITRRLLSSASVDQAPVQPSETGSYQLGDLSRFLIHKVTKSSPETQNSPATDVIDDQKLEEAMSEFTLMDGQ